MTLAQAKGVLRQFRAALARFPGNLAHVACGAVEPPPPATSCDDVAQMIATSDGVLIVPLAQWAQAEEAWAVFEAAHPGFGQQWRDGNVGHAVAVLGAAVGSGIDRGVFFFSLAVVAATTILAIKRGLG